MTSESEITIMNILFTELEGWEEEYLRRELDGHRLTLLKQPLGPEHYPLLKDVEIMAPFVYSPVTAEVLAAMPNLKMVTTRSTGYDHVDLKLTSARGIIVCNVPFYGENTVAEHTWALILALSRKIFQSYERT